MVCFIKVDSHFYWIICGFVGDEEKQDSRLSIVLNGHSKPVRSLCWSSYEGARLISGGDDGVAQVWDVITGNIISTFTGHNLEAILAALWSPMDKNFIITGGKDNCIRIWNIDEHKPMTEAGNIDFLIIPIAFI